jgi:hypothetical protein
MNCKFGGSVHLVGGPGLVPGGGWTGTGTGAGLGLGTGTGTGLGIGLVLVDVKQSDGQKYVRALHPSMLHWDADRSAGHRR